MSTRFRGHVSRGVIGATVLAFWFLVVDGSQGNVLATLAMGSYLWVKHPKLREALAAFPMDKTT